MKKAIDAAEFLESRAGRDSEFRARLLASPKDAIEQEFGVRLPADHEIHVHEESYSTTHLVLPPPSKLSPEEREAARTGAASLEFLKKTMYDPAPPIRPHCSKPEAAGVGSLAPESLAKAGRESIRRGLAFLESTIDDHGAWHCIRYNVANPEVPRHFERPPFVSALCVLALESCDEARAKAMCTATRAYLAKTIEYPGFWRYYRHLPQDLDSTTLCSLVIGTHPWILLGRNVPGILANRDTEGRFKTWLLSRDEPNVVATFRFEADPVVNANVIAYLGDRPETRRTQRWLEALITEGDLERLVQVVSRHGRDLLRNHPRHGSRAACPRSTTPRYCRSNPGLAGQAGRIRQHPSDRSGGVGTRQHVGRLESIDAKRHGGEVDGFAA